MESRTASVSTLIFARKSRSSLMPAVLACQISRDRGALLPKKASQFLYMAHFWVFQLAPGNHSDGLVSDPRPRGDSRPAIFRAFQFPENVVVESFCHGPESNPEFGRMQPANGFIADISSEGMGRPRKKVPAKGQLEERLGRQLRTWMGQALRKYGHQTRQIDVLSKRSGVGKETIRQILNGRQSARVNNLQAIAAALGWTLADLFSETETAPAPPNEAIDVELEGLRRG